VTDLAFRIARDGALRREKFVFTSANGTEASATEEKKDQANAASNEPGEVRVGVRFGIAPGDYSGELEGVLIGEVFDGLPAAKAGLKSGDLMVKWNGKDLVDVESWMPMLNKHKPGDVVEIVYVRDGKEDTVKATLIARTRQQQ
jgi:S1-C subfamily serine protease